MNTLKKKLNKNGGFTLIEMLIVVAIIAILIAVSIPLINNALEKSRDATDKANERAAKAEAVLVFMGQDANTTFAPTGTNNAQKYYYDAVNGKLVDAAAKPTPGYGQCTQTHTDTKFASVSELSALTATTAKVADDTGDHDGEVLAVQIFKDGTVELSWE